VRLFHCEESHDLGQWPTLAGTLGDRNGFFYLLVALGMVPRIRDYHRSLGVPQEATRTTCLQIRCFWEIHQRDHQGRGGISFGRLNWLRNYVRSPYFRVGRLEYWLRPNPSKPVVYRCRTSGSVIAMAQEDENFTPGGFLDGEEAPVDSWSSTFIDDDDGAIGHPITPQGAALPFTVELPYSRWERVLSKGDEILQIHIPFGEKLTPKSVGESMKEAVTFFRTYFPDASPRAFGSSSWMFSPILEQLLPSESNVVRFPSEFYLFPIPSGPHGGLGFIFPDGDFDPKTASRDTSLQRAILDFVASGGRWRAGGMFFLIDDVDRVGKQPYRQGWPPAEVREAMEEI